MHGQLNVKICVLLVDFVDFYALVVRLCTVLATSTSFVFQLDSIRCSDYATGRTTDSAWCDFLVDQEIFFFLRTVTTDSGGHEAYCSVGKAGIFSGDEAAET